MIDGTEEKMKEPAVMASYLRERLVPAFLYIAEALLFLVIAALYGYKDVLENMTYALWLVFFLGACFLLWDYRKYRQKCLVLWQNRMREEREKYLPEPLSLAEKLYRQIIACQEQEKQECVTKLDKERQDMSDYYTMWTHQIKTPLAAMRLLIQDIGHSEADAQAAKQLSEQLFKTEQYADMALSYARLQSICKDLSFQKQDVFMMVKDAVKKYSVLFIGSGINLSLEAFEAEAVTDRKWFTFVIEQLLSNALKYTEQGRISIYGTDESGVRVSQGCKIIVIEDTGIGIGESDLPRIFERGFTGYNGRMDKKSTGIGLYLCRQIMDRLGFPISIESKQGEGTKALLDIRQTGRE